MSGLRGRLPKPVSALRLDPSIELFSGLVSSISANNNTQAAPTRARGQPSLEEQRFSSSWRFSFTSAWLGADKAPHSQLEKHLLDFFLMLTEALKSSCLTGLQWPRLATLPDISAEASGIRVPGAIPGIPRGQSVRNLAQTHASLLQPRTLHFSSELNQEYGVKQKSWS